MVLVPVEKGSCAALVRKTKLLAAQACNECAPLIELERNKAERQCIATEGVCVRIHGTEEEKQQLQQKDAGSKNRGDFMRQSRSSRSSSRNVKFHAAPANHAKLNNERRDPRDVQKRQAKRKRDAIQTIHTAGANDPQVQQLLLGLLTGKENNNLSHGGASKAAKNEANATAGNAVNGLVKLLASKAPDQEGIIRESLSANATKQAPKKAPPPPPLAAATAPCRCAGGCAHPSMSFLPPPNWL